MQIQTIIIATLAAVATAMPGKDDGKGYETGHWGKDGGKDYAGSRWGKECKPIAYECTDNHNKPGWNVCNTSGKWEFGGFCPPKTKCFFNEKNQSPYCI